MMETLGRIPPRATLINLANNEEMKFQFNPTTFVETISARYARISPPRLPHQRLVYEGTSNDSIPIELFMSQLAQDIEAGRAASRPFIPTDRKNFIQSLLYPVAVSGTPPQVLFIWPRMVSIVARIVGNVQFAHKRFQTQNGVTTELVVKFTVEEDRDIGLLMEEVRRKGSTNPTEQLFSGPAALQAPLAT